MKSPQIEHDLPSSVYTEKKPVLSAHSSFKFSNTFDLLSNIYSWKPILVFFWGRRLRQVLL